MARIITWSSLTSCPHGIGLGKSAAYALEKAGIVSNCNTVQFDLSTPFKPSWVRVGTPAVTTRGMNEPEMEKIGTWISEILHGRENYRLQVIIKKEVEKLCNIFPLHENNIHLQYSL
jgi:glycine hydroxymethyltransferase